MKVIGTEVESVDALEIDLWHVVGKVAEHKADVILDGGIIVIAGAVVELEDAIVFGGSGCEELLLLARFLNKGGCDVQFSVIPFGDGEVAILRRVDLVGEVLKVLFRKPSTIRSGDTVVDHREIIDSNEQCISRIPVVIRITVIVGLVVGVILLARSKRKAKGHQSHGKEGKVFFHGDYFMMLICLIDCKVTKKSENIKKLIFFYRPRIASATFYPIRINAAKPDTILFLIENLDL